MYDIVCIKRSSFDSYFSFFKRNVLPFKPQQFSASETAEKSQNVKYKIFQRFVCHQIEDCLNFFYRVYLSGLCLLLDGFDILAGIFSYVLIVDCKLVYVGNDGYIVFL